MLILIYINLSINEVTEKMNPRKFRHELKYYLNTADYLIIKNRLSTIAGPDEHTDSKGSYRIRSLYFETPDDKALLEKLYGVNEREKFRSWYTRSGNT